MKVYISGPITGKPNGNKYAFKKVQPYIKYLGYEYVCPHDICAHLPIKSEWIEYMQICLRELPHCQGIYMLKGWIWSRGARIEWLIAKLLGIKRIK